MGWTDAFETPQASLIDVLGVPRKVSSLEGPVWPRKVVEAFPFGELGLEIDVVLVSEELVELVLVGSVRL
jgi:hypothetical protein